MDQLVVIISAILGSSVLTAVVTAVATRLKVRADSKKSSAEAKKAAAEAQEAQVGTIITVDNHMMDRIRRLEDQRDRYEIKFDDQQKEIRELQRKIFELELINTKYLNENNILKEQIKALQEENELLKEANNRLREENELLKQKLGAE